MLSHEDIYQLIPMKKWQKILKPIFNRKISYLTHYYCTKQICLNKNFLGI